MRTMHPIGLWDNKQCTESHNYICETPRTGFTPAPTTAPKILPCPPGWKSFATFCYKVFITNILKTQSSSLELIALVAKALFMICLH